MTEGIVAIAIVLVVAMLPRVPARLLLSRAKHPSLTGHVRIAKRLAKLLPYYAYDDAEFYRSDGAPPDVAARRRDAFARLAAHFRERSPATLEATAAMAPMISDVQFINSYRVPFQYRAHVQRHLQIGSVVNASNGVTVTDLDGNASYDVAGSYGLNLFGYDFYKSCIDAGIDRVRALGPLLGAYHPVVADNVRRLRTISQLDEVSFHMSGTEAVMQAVRLARYHTGRSHLVQFSGAYHGWWDGVQPGVGNPRAVNDVYLLKEMDETTLKGRARRHDIACVLVNPIQMLHPNASAPGDGSLVTSASAPSVDRAAYSAWLRALRAVCTARGIALILHAQAFRLVHL